jgi:hypothetical protein
MCTKVRKNIVGLKTALKCAFVCNRDKKAPSFRPFSFGGLLLLLLRLSLASFARVSSPQQLSCERFLLSLSLSLACLVAARAVRPSFRTQYAVGLCLVLLSLSARGSVRSEWGDFFPSLSRPPHFALKSLSKLQKDNVLYAGVFGSHWLVLCLRISKSVRRTRWIKSYIHLSVLQVFCVSKMGGGLGLGRGIRAGSSCFGFSSGASSAMTTCIAMLLLLLCQLLCLRYAGMFDRPLNAMVEYSVFPNSCRAVYISLISWLNVVLRPTGKMCLREEEGSWGSGN